MKFKKNINKYIKYLLIGLFNLMLLVVSSTIKANVSYEYSLNQDSTAPCKVELSYLIGSYQGECKNGFANGQGEAVGIHHYNGVFKNGLPDGKGTYYFTDGSYYSGSFQDGIKEGRGEMHFVRKDLPDSVIKGYWSGDQYKGKVYNTYRFSTSETFDLIEISPSAQSGNSITIELSTTSGAPDGTAVSLTGKNRSGYVLTLTDIFSTNGCNVIKTLSTTTTSRSSYTYTLSNFPANLFLTLSNGRTIELDLYKSAKWLVRLNLNK